MEKLIALQIIAHLLVDFTLQPAQWCASKFQLGFRSKYLYLHTLIVFLVAWVFSFSVSFIWFALGIAITHLIVDGLKSITERKIHSKNRLNRSDLSTAAFLTDQLVHLAIIILASILYCRLYTPANLPEPFSLYILLIIIGYLLCIKPSNVFIQKILQAYSLFPENNPEENKDLEKAGRLIGNLERILAFTLVLFGQYSAVGFIVAAKTILRYREGDVKKTEYVLIGTLLSFGIAILLGIGIKEQIFIHFLKIL